MYIDDRRLASLKALLLAIFTIASVTFASRSLLPSLAQNDEEREIEDKIPKHLPLKVKLKTEKEAKVKDFKNDQWVRDFELEVTNTSEKPIYFLNVWVLLPEFIGPSGGVRGMPLRYGRMDFIKHDTRPIPEDVPIKPGDTYTFKIPETDQQGWYARQAAGPVKNPRKLQFIFSDLSFGDGTGFSGTTALPYPKKQISKAELDGRCLEQRAQKQEGRSDVWIGPPDLLIREPLFETSGSAPAGSLF
jgi:hypothetical protein